MKLRLEAYRAVYMCRVHHEMETTEFPEIIWEVDCPRCGRPTAYREWCDHCLYPLPKLKVDEIWSMIAS